jgi:hypothetical protein
MSIITIPKTLAAKDDLVVIPRKEYEALLGLKKIREFTPTATHKHALARARKNRAKGNVMTVNELKQNLGFTG